MTEFQSAAVRAIGSSEQAAALARGVGADLSLPAWVRDAAAKIILLTESAADDARAMGHYVTRQAEDFQSVLARNCELHQENYALRTRTDRDVTPAPHADARDSAA